MGSFNSVIFIIFYGYAFSIYRRQKTRREGILKHYSNLVLDDSLDSPPLETRERKNL